MSSVTPPEKMNAIPISHIPTPPILLLDVHFSSGHCREEIDRIADPAARDMALMQYYYFTCRSEQAARTAAAYLDSDDWTHRIAALLIYTFAQMVMGHAKEAQNGKEQLKAWIALQDDFSAASGVSLLLSAVKSMLGLPLADAERQAIEEQDRHCDEGGRLLCCFLLEQNTWKAKDFERIIGTVETALRLAGGSYPLLTLYFYLSASNAALQLKDMARAEDYFQKAWALAEADGFWAPIGEMQGHLQLFLEKQIKPQCPEPYKKINEAARQNRSGWREFVSEEPLPKEERQKLALRETLTAMEYTVSLLAGQGWSNREIADYFGISVRTVKYYLTAAFTKLHIDKRQEIADLLD